MTEAKNRLSALLAEVRAGESVLIVDRGVPVARLDPVVGRGEDAPGRIARLQRSGVLQPARQEPPIGLVLEQPPTHEAGASVVDLVLAERSVGR